MGHFVLGFTITPSTFWTHLPHGTFCAGFHYKTKYILDSSFMWDILCWVSLSHHAHSGFIHYLTIKKNPTCWQTVCDWKKPQPAPSQIYRSIKKGGGGGGGGGESLQYVVHSTYSTIMSEKYWYCRTHLKSKNNPNPNTLASTVSVPQAFQLTVSRE